MARDKFIMVKVSDIEKEMAKRLADSEGRSLSSLVRRLISLEVDKHIEKADSARSN